MKSTEESTENCDVNIAKRRTDKREHCVRPICWQFLVVFVRRGAALNSFYVYTSPWCFILLDSFSCPTIVKCCSKSKFLKAFGICIDDLMIYIMIVYILQLPVKSIYIQLFFLQWKKKKLYICFQTSVNFI